MDPRTSLDTKEWRKSPPLRHPGSNLGRPARSEVPCRLRHQKRVVWQNCMSSIGRFLIEFQSASENTASIRTVHRGLHKLGFYSLAAAYKPNITKTNASHLLKWFKEWCHWILSNVVEFCGVKNNASPSRSLTAGLGMEDARWMSLTILSVYYQLWSLREEASLYGTVFLGNPIEYLSDELECRL